MMKECNKKVVALIQAHMSSTRLPGKIMIDLCGKPILYRVIERARQCRYLDNIVVATSDLPCDDQVAVACESWGVHVFRGSDTDVLSRFWGAAHAFPADCYMRLTSDNPLIDPAILDQAIQFFLTSGYRYIHTNSKLPLGMGAELFSGELLDEAFENATERFEHEHVTPYMYWKQESVGETAFICDGSCFRVTLDTPEDLEVIRSVYSALLNQKNDFSLGQILDYLNSHPEISSLNSHVVQKKATD